MLNWKPALAPLAALAFFPASVLADGPAAPAAVDADQPAKVIPLKLNIEGAPVEMKPRFLNAAAAGGQSTAGSPRLRAQAAAGTTLFLKTSSGDHVRLFSWGGNVKGEAGMALALGAQVRADATSAGLRSLDVRTGGPAAFQLYGTDSQPASNEGGKATAPTLTYALKTIAGSYQYRDQKDLGVQVNVGRITLADASFHKAFKLGLPIDICGQAAFHVALGTVQVARGEQATSGAGFERDLQACAGVQLGQVGRLGYDFKQSVITINPGKPNGDFTETSHSASLRKIGGTPIGVSYSHEISSANAAAESAPTRSLTTNWVQVQGEF